MFRRIPALGVLRGYTLDDGRHDLVAGLSVAAVAVPQAMAYALIVGLPAEYGLYCAIVMTAVGAVLAPSRQIINGPTNAISIALLSAIGHLEGAEERIQGAVVMGLLIGLFQLAISVLRLGDLTRFISHSVIVGFTAGASVLLVLDQTKNLLGLSAIGGVHDHFLVRFGRTLLDGGPIHGPTVALGVGSIVAVLALRLVKTKLGVKLLPELLIVVAGSAALTWALDLEALGVKVIGDIPGSLPPFRVPRLAYEQVRDLSPSALAVGLLGLLEAVAMAKAIAAVTRQKLDLNQQCLSEAGANLAGAFFSAIPGSGSLTRSAINLQAGARTQWAGVISAVAVAVVMLVFAPYARFVPRAALAGILMLTAGRMVNLHELRYHVRVSRFDAIIVTATAVSAIAISIEFCVLIGVFLSFLLAVPRAGQMLLTEFVVTPEGQIHERLDGDHVCGRLLIFGLEGEMFFGSAVALDQHLDTIEARVDDHTQAVVLRMKRARSPDAVGMMHLEGLIDRLTQRGVYVVLCGVRRELDETMRRCGLRDRLHDDQVFLEQPVRLSSTVQAIRHASTHLTEGCPDCPRAMGKLYYAV